MVLCPVHVPPIGNAQQPASHPRDRVAHVTSVLVSTFPLLPQLPTHVPTRDSFALHRNVAASRVEPSHILQPTSRVGDEKSVDIMSK